MSLIKQIVKPERFTAMDLASGILRHLEWKDAPEDIRRAFIDATVYALGDLVAEGILSCEEKP